MQIQRKHTMLTNRFVFLLVVMVLVIATPLNAAFVQGVFSPGSTTVRVTQNDMLFYTIPGGTLVGASGNFQVLNPATMSFAPYVLQVGAIEDLTRSFANHTTFGYQYAPTDTDLTAGCPGSPTPGTPCPVVNFMTIPAVGINPGINLELTSIASAHTENPAAGVCNPALWHNAGYTCFADATSPFLLTNTANNSGQINTTVLFDASGLAWFVNTPTQRSNADYGFSATLVGDIGTQIANLGSPGFDETSLSGQITVTAFAPPPPPVPEPATTVLIGFGLIVGSLVLRKRVVQR